MSQNNHLGFVHRFEAATQPGAPALMLLHGSGGDEASLLAVGRAIAPGAALLSPRGNATDHGTPRFFARPDHSSDAAAEVQARILELAAFARAAAQHYQFAAPPLLVGFSNGATMALLLLLYSRMKWPGAILMRGMGADHHYPVTPLLATPVLILSGIQDPLVQTDQVQELANQLRDAGAEVTLHWEETGHHMSQGDLLMAFDWIRRFYHLPRPATITQ
jgi:phospholipase/carboxylesterase